MLQNKLISSLKKELEINKGLADIVIFGSAARTNFQNYDDIDLLIVFKNSISSLNRAITIENLEALHGINIAPLVKFSNPDNPLIKPILNYGPDPGRIPNSKYHTFYCKERDLETPVNGIEKIKEEMISIAIPIFNYQSGVIPAFNYHGGLIPVFNYMSDKLPIHSLYCKEEDLDLKDIFGIKFVQEKVSLKELTR